MEITYENQIGKAHENLKCKGRVVLIIMTLFSFKIQFNKWCACVCVCTHVCMDERASMCSSTSTCLIIDTTILIKSQITPD